MLPAVISIYSELDERACHEPDEDLSLRVVEDEEANSLELDDRLSLRAVEDDEAITLELDGFSSGRLT